MSEDPHFEVRREPLTYEPESRTSFFGDLMRAEVYKDEIAIARLERHQREMVVEKRVNPNTTLGLGGEFSPPLWLIDDDHVKTAARAGRTLGDLVPNQVLPPGTDAVFVPKVSVGSSDTIQPGQGADDPDTDLTSTSFGPSQIQTLSGQSDVSQQLYDMSPAGFDRWAYLDLHADYNAQLESQLINGTGTNGQILGLSNFTLATANNISGSSVPSAYPPTVTLLWPILGQAYAAVANNRKLQPQYWLMCGRRWAFIAASLDSSSRPVASPHSGADAPHWPPAGGYPPAGDIMGLPVYLSGAITAGTSADTIYCVRPDDMFLLESAEKYRVMVSPLAGSLQVRLQLHRYVAFVGNAYTTGLSIITALPAPTNY